MEMQTASFRCNSLHQRLTGFVGERNGEDDRTTAGRGTCRRHWVLSRVVNTIGEHDDDFDRGCAGVWATGQGQSTLVDSTANIGPTGAKTICVRSQRS